MTCATSRRSKASCAAKRSCQSSALHQFGLFRQTGQCGSGRSANAGRRVHKRTRSPPAYSSVILWSLRGSPPGREDVLPASLTVQGLEDPLLFRGHEIRMDVGWRRRRLPGRFPARDKALRPAPADELVRVSPGHVPGGVKTGQRGPAPLVNPITRLAMTANQIRFGSGDLHWLPAGVDAVRRPVQYDPGIHIEKRFLDLTRPVPGKMACIQAAWSTARLELLDRSVNAGSRWAHPPLRDGQSAPA